MLPAGCLIGALGGTALDKHFHTGWIAVVGILLGAAAGFIAIYRTASKAMKRDG
jgi:F0F1-type ATP synthase assembly protein I